MSKAKQIRVAPISSRDANRIVKKHHYSGKVVNNSQLHLGVFLNGKCGGALQFGPSMDRRKLIGLVRGTKWNEFLELNRFALADWLPRNSESRSIAYSLRWIRKTYPHIKWVISFADATLCGDGTIYRATGFVLTQIRKNKSTWKLKTGEIVSAVTYGKSVHARQNQGSAGHDTTLRKMGATRLPGYQLRYIYFLDKTYRDKLTVPEIPYEKIKELNASMYKGKTRV